MRWTRLLVPRWSRLPGMVAGILTGSLLGSIMFPAAPAQTTAQPAYLTILFGRAQMYTSVEPSNCVQLPNTVSLPNIAAQMHALGDNITGAVVTSYTQQTGISCSNHNAYPSWAQIDAMTAQDGASFVSAGVLYEDNTTLSPQAAEANICGSLPAFTAHGQTRAWGLFAYPNNGHSPALQSNVTDQCFAYGRTYGSTVNDGSVAPYWAVTDSITGGACNTPNLPCSNIITLSASHAGETTSQKYWSLPALEAAMHPTAGQWSIVQPYKMITGSYRPGATSGQTWDCTSPNWRDHYTSISETYCWNDFLAALKTIAAGVTVTDPATVAQSWGRTPTQ